MSEWINSKMQTSSGLIHNIRFDRYDRVNIPVYYYWNGGYHSLDSGFTIQQMFDELDATIVDPAEFPTNLIVGLPTNTQSAVNNLFGSY